jgi:hypothetical protein
MGAGYDPRHRGVDWVEEWNCESPTRCCAGRGSGRGPGVERRRARGGHLAVLVLGTDGRRGTPMRRLGRGSAGRRGVERGGSEKDLAPRPRAPVSGARVVEGGGTVAVRPGGPSRSWGASPALPRVLSSTSAGRSRRCVRSDRWRGAGGSRASGDRVRCGSSYDLIARLADARRAHRRNRGRGVMTRSRRVFARSASANDRTRAHFTLVVGAGHAGAGGVHRREDGCRGRARHDELRFWPTCRQSGDRGL